MNEMFLGFALASLVYLISIRRLYQEVQQFHKKWEEELAKIEEECNG